MKDHLDKGEFDIGLQACAAIIKSTGGVEGIPLPAQFAVCSSYGLCALKMGDIRMAEEFCLKADQMEAPPAQSQKNLKVVM